MLGVLLPGACAGFENNIPTPRAEQPTSVDSGSGGTVTIAPLPPGQQPTRVIPRPGGAMALSKPGYPGIWGIWSDGISTEGRPWFKGQVITLKWKEVEPA